MVKLNHDFFLAKRLRQALQGNTPAIRRGTGWCSGKSVSDHATFSQTSQKNLSEYMQKTTVEYISNISEGKVPALLAG